MAAFVGYKVKVTDDSGNLLGNEIMYFISGATLDGDGNSKSSSYYFEADFGLTEVYGFSGPLSYLTQESSNFYNTMFVTYPIYIGAVGAIRRIYFDEHSYIRLSLTSHHSDYQGDTYKVEYYKDSNLLYWYDNAVYCYDLTSRFKTLRCQSIRFPYRDSNNEFRLSHVILNGTVDTEDLTNNSCTVTGVSSTVQSWASDWVGEWKPVDADNPFSPGGTSEEGGGSGNFSEESDDVDVDQMPTIDAVGTGFATLFTPTKTQLSDLASVMWDSNVFTALQNLVENITGMFTSLAIVPFEVTAGRTVEITLLGLPITELFLTLAAKQYYEFDMGSIDMKNDGRIFTSGSALDYSPFSSLGIFLPFIGFQDLDIDECRDSVINLKYRIDILSGTCVALISLNGNTIYQFTGNCLSQIPITNENMQSLVTDAVQVGIAAAATHSAKGAVGAAEASMGEAETAKETKAAKAALGHAEAHLAQTKAGLASATANASMGMKPVYGKTGAISASASLLGVKQPYLFLRTPRQSIPEHYQRYCGFPSNMTGKLSSFSGYTVVEDIRLNGLVATSPEVAEIYELLKGGVII